MSLISSLNTSRSGLQSVQKWSEVTARNIANSTTVGYVRKDVQLTTSNGAVRVSSISREVNVSIDDLHRNEISKMSKQQAIAEGIEAYTAFLGQPNDEMSPAHKIGQFENAMLSLSNAPGTAAFQDVAVAAAQDLTYSINDISKNLENVSAEVVQEIRYSVADVNTSLNRVSELNARMMRINDPELRGEIMDEIDREIDSISEIMNIRTSQGSDGRYKIYTSGGTTLVEEDQVYNLSYDRATGTLNVGNIDITPTNPNTRGFTEGRLAGLYDLKENTLPLFGKQLDELARTLIETFNAADSSLAPGEAGMFTDGGLPFDPANLNGLASRIKVNSAAVRAEGGSSTAIIKGFGSSAGARPIGDPTQVNAYLQIFSTQQSYDGMATRLPETATIGSFANNLVAYQQTQRANAIQDYSIAETSARTIQSARSSYEGVNLDDELQKLILIEQSFAANSKTISTISNMMDTLLSIV
jgi:flagellar hook-associated protein 1 FlgK